MRFLYGTDFHGEERRYVNALKFAREQEINLIHIGADILPKGSEIFKRQKKFVEGYLKKWWNECKEAGITVLGMFGNDDLYTKKKYFKEYATILDEYPHFREGYRFYGYPYVPDYPFGLKTACKLDYPRWKQKVAYLGKSLDVDETGFVVIEDLDSYFKKKGTIRKDLVKMPGGDKVIMAIHCPPQGLELDVCANGNRVGSRSVTRWITKEQPLLVLSGHIHESFNRSGVWKAKIGKTTVIQPGQVGLKTTLVLVEVNDATVSANLVSI